MVTSPRGGEAVCQLACSDSRPLGIHRYEKENSHYRCVRLHWQFPRGACAGSLEVWAAVRPQTNRQYLQDERIRFIELDLGNSDRLTEQLEAHREQQGVFHYVIHAAGATKCRRSDDFFRVNARGTERLAYTLLETGCLQPQGRFVFISSLSVYGHPRIGHASHHGG